MCRMRVDEGLQDRARRPSTVRVRTSARGARYANHEGESTDLIAPLHAAEGMWIKRRPVERFGFRSPVMRAGRK